MGGVFYASDLGDDFFTIINSPHIKILNPGAQDGSFISGSQLVVAIFNGLRHYLIGFGGRIRKTEVAGGVMRGVDHWGDDVKIINQIGEFLANAKVVVSKQGVAENIKGDYGVRIGFFNLGIYISSGLINDGFFELFFIVVDWINNIINVAVGKANIVKI